MIGIKVFQAVAELATGAKARSDADYREFLAFYRELVETVPTDVVVLFGTLSIGVVSQGEARTGWGIQLTPTDFLFWKRHIEGEGTRFTQPVGTVQLLMLEHLAKKAEAHRLTPEQRKTLLALLDAEPTA